VGHGLWRRGQLGSLVLLLAAALLILRPWEGEGREGGPASARALVIRAVDGDTIEALIGGRAEDVRYIGVDTPETVKPDTPVQCYGPNASDENHRLVEGRTVRLVFDREARDDYGRLLAYVYAGGRFVNAELARGGYARTLTIAPNTSHAAEFQRLATRAARAGRGLWGTC
jgi:micrococcal nuclease